MDNEYADLDDAKAEVEKLRDECRIKNQVIESLKRDRSEEFLRFQETKQQAEKQAHELHIKSEEIYELKKIREELKSSLHQKETSIAHLTSENEKIQASCTERVRKLEESNRDLVLTLDEWTARNNLLEQNASASSEEISGLKTLLSAVEKKCSEAEEKARHATMLRHRNDVIRQLEEENISLQDQIKWRNEQFKHLEEAHEKLQVQFRISKEEWDKERSTLLDEISSLQTSLDSQTRIAEGLQSRLEMCNNALAHEESKRKLLEAEIAEFKANFGDVFSQCEENRSKIQQLTVVRSDEIAQLRDSLGEREALVRELEHKNFLLEQDNQELGDSIKELREAQIHKGGANYLISKLRNKLRRLEEAHKSCSSILKSKESQWDDQVAKMEADVMAYKSMVTNKDQEIQKLQRDLEKCYYDIEENHMGLLIFKSELAEVHSKSFCAETTKAVCMEEKEDMILISDKQLRAKDSSLQTMVQQHLLLEEELKQQKKKSEESYEGSLVLKEKLLQMENTLKYERSVAIETQQILKLEIANKNEELSRLDCELQNWKSTAETLKVSCEEIEGTCKKMETSLLSQIENEQTLKQANENFLCIVKDQERKIEDFQQQTVLLEIHNMEKTEEAERLKQEKEYLIRITEEKDSCIRNLQQDISIACLKQESMKKNLENAILARRDVEKALEQEKDILWKIKGENDETIKNFQEVATTMEQDLLGALCFSFSKQVEKWVEVSVLTEALKNAECLGNLEIEEKNTRIAILESEINTLLENFGHMEESFFHSKQEAKQLEASLEAMKLKTETLTGKLQTMEYITAELKFEKGNLLQDVMKLSTEREVMLVHMEDICGRIGELSTEDMQLMEKLENALNASISVDENETAVDSQVCDKLHGFARDDASSLLLPPAMKKIEENFDDRSPLREVNSLHM